MKCALSEQHPGCFRTDLTPEEKIVLLTACADGVLHRKLEHRKPFEVDEVILRRLPDSSEQAITMTPRLLRECAGSLWRFAEQTVDDVHAVEESTQDPNVTKELGVARCNLGLTALELYLDMETATEAYKSGGMYDQVDGLLAHAATLSSDPSVLHAEIETLLKAEAGMLPE